jgi:hypothetical protein
MTTATRHWAMTDATQQRILDAATEVFAARGFTAASIGTPAGFDGVRRHSMLSGFRRWTSVLELYTSPRGQLLTRILIAMMAEASGW